MQMEQAILMYLDITTMEEAMKLRNNNEMGIYRGFKGMKEKQEMM